MIIYCAGPWAAKVYIESVAVQLRERGHDVSSFWHASERPVSASTVGTSAASSDDDALRHALDDLDSVTRSNLVVHFTSSACIAADPDIPTEWLHTGGRHVEIGAALVNAIPVAVIGDPENIFARTLCTPYKTVEEFMVWLDS